MQMSVAWICFLLVSMRHSVCAALWGAYDTFDAVSVFFFLCGGEVSISRAAAAVRHALSAAGACTSLQMNREVPQLREEGLSLCLRENA